jgi:hypothetical protein
MLYFCVEFTHFCLLRNNLLLCVFPSF